LEDEVQDLQPALANAKQELEACREELAPLRASLKDAEAALSQARADLEKQQRVGAVTRGLAGEPEKPQWPDEMLGSLSRTQSRPDSPLLSVSRTMSGDLAGFQIPSKARRTPLSDSRPDSPADGFSLSRRMSSQPFGRLSALSPVGSSIPPMPFSPFEPPSESHIQSPSLAERDDPTDDRIPSSPRQVAQDMISVSTAGAGPSVQLVERMSAAIRRLEGEKVAAKEEMARVCSQRDEARSDMVQLMKDIDASKSAMNKVPELEKELKDLHSRYQTTLELLGEKSELVEELKADVQDVKAMYRELVERTVK
jgi:TATA element modulatory factor